MFRDYGGSEGQHNLKIVNYQLIGDGLKIILGLEGMPPPPLHNPDAKKLAESKFQPEKIGGKSAYIWTTKLCIKVHYLMIEHNWENNWQCCLTVVI